MTQGLLQEVVSKYDIILQHLGSFNDREIGKVREDVQKEKEKLIREGAAVSVNEAKGFALGLWMRLNDQLYDKYISACSGNVMRLRVPAVVGAAMELVCLFESEGI